MGASGWSYFVPYRDDLNDVLQSLRNETFRKKEFYCRGDKTKPQTIQKLFEMNEEDGTHSILDISAIATKPDLGVAAPLTKDQMLAIFGTERPERSMVDAKANEVADLRSRREGTYVVLYKDGKPDEVWFTGFSGD